MSGRRDKPVPDTSDDQDLPLRFRQKPCDACGEAAFWRNYCGVWVCGECEAHVGLGRCYCGWSAGGGDGRAELVEMGETIGDEYPGGDL